MRRSWKLIVVALCLVSATASVSSGDVPKKALQYQIDIGIWEGDPLGSCEDGTMSPLSQPCVATVEKQEASVFSGQVVKIDGEEFQVGARLKITPERGEGGTIKLKLFFEYSMLQRPVQENSCIVQSNQARYTRIVKPGELLRLYLGKSSAGVQWVEVTVKEYDEKK